MGGSSASHSAMVSGVAAAGNEDRGRVADRAARAATVARFADDPRVARCGLARASGGLNPITIIERSYVHGVASVIREPFIHQTGPGPARFAH